MTSRRPYLSVDLETTGLDLDQSQIIQIAAVYDDGELPLEELRHCNVFVHDTITYAEVGALALHEKSGLFTKLRDAFQAGESRGLADALDLFLNFIESCRTTTWFRLTLAGKNFGTYDLPLLRRWMTPDQRRRFQQLVNSSVIDVGSIYYPLFGRIPSLEEILRLLPDAPREVSHDALEDATNVVRAIRHNL